MVVKCLLVVFGGSRLLSLSPARFGPLGDSKARAQDDVPERSRRDAQEKAGGGGFRGSIQAPSSRGSRNERGEAFVRFLHPDPVSLLPSMQPTPSTSRLNNTGSCPNLRGALHKRMRTLAGVSGCPRMEKTWQGDGRGYAHAESVSC